MFSYSGLCVRDDVGSDVEPHPRPTLPAEGSGRQHRLHSRLISRTVHCGNLHHRRIV